MKHLKIFVLFSLVILLIPVSSCSNVKSPYAFDYPKKVTPKYCYENYSAFDANIIYTECYEFVANKKWNKWKPGLNTSIEYSAIRGDEDLSFMVYYKTIFWFGENRWRGIVRHNDCDIEPIMDYTVSKIELCTYKYIDPEQFDIEQEPEKYYNYAAYAFHDTIVTIDSQEAMAEIMAVAQRPTTMTTEENYQEQRDFPYAYGYGLSSIIWNNESVYVKISFDECAGMVWIGKLLIDDDGRVYMERCAYVGDSEAVLSVGNTFSTPYGKSFYYPLGEHMNEIVSGLEAMKGEGN